MPKITLDKLRRIAKIANDKFPSFLWTAMSQKEVEGIGMFDPPCAVVMGSSALLGNIIICTDGEAYVNDHCFEIDLSKPSEEILTNLINKIRYGKAGVPGQLKKHLIEMLDKARQDYESSKGPGNTDKVTRLHEANVEAWQIALNLFDKTK